MKIMLVLVLFKIAGQLAQGLAHQSGLQADVRVAHFAFNFRARHQGGHGVNDNQIHRAGAHQFFGDFQGLLARVRLGNKQFVHIYADGRRIDGVQRVFGVNKRHHAAVFLRLAATCRDRVVLPPASGP